MKAVNNSGIQGLQPPFRLHYILCCNWGGFSATTLYVEFSLSMCVCTLVHQYLFHYYTTSFMQRTSKNKTYQTFRSRTIGKKNILLLLDPFGDLVSTQSGWGSPSSALPHLDVWLGLYQLLPLQTPPSRVLSLPNPPVNQHGKWKSIILNRKCIYKWWIWLPYFM